MYVNEAAAVDSLHRIAQENWKGGIYSKVEFCNFVLWSFDYNLASSFLSKVIVKTERLAQQNKINLRINPSFKS